MTHEGKVQKSMLKKSTVLKRLAQIHDQLEYQFLYVSTIKPKTFNQ